MSVLGTIVDLGTSAISGGALGLLARAGMQVIGFYQKKQDDQHALDMKKLDQSHELVLLKESRDTAIAIAKGELQKIEVQGYADVAAEEARAFTAAQQVAGKPTGIRWVDAWNATMRPFSFYLLLALYSLAKFATTTALWSHTDWANALLNVWTQFDMALLGSAFGFVWADRTFSRGFASTATRNTP